MIGTSATSAAWQSVHIHYEAQDALLVECIGPLVASARAHGLQRWFFLRYWKGGPHVRLRLQIEAGAPPRLWDEVMAGLGSYLREKPSESRMSAETIEREQRTLAALEGESAGAVIVYPNNTLVAATYTPEFDTYGGPAGVALAESFFEASSDTVIAALSESGGATKGRLNMAFAMMLTGLREAGYAARELDALFAAYVRFYERFVPAATWRSLEEKVRRPEVLSQFGAALEASASVQPRPWLQRWAVTFSDAARALHEHDALVRPAVTLARTMDARQFVLFNYLHTHNNRLGVTPALEAQIAYVAHHALAHHAAAHHAAAPQSSADHADAPAKDVRA